MTKNAEKISSENLIPFYKIYVYGEENNKIEEILVNPKINNSLGGPDGIYSLISSKFEHQYTPMNHTMKIKFANIWYTINDINIYNFCVSGNISAGESILIKLLINTINDNNENKFNEKNNYDGEENDNKDEYILEANKIENNPVPIEKKIYCSLCRKNDEYFYKRLLKLFGPFRYKNKNYYAHFLCLIYIPEIEISEENNKFKNPGKIIHDYIGLRCAFCGEKGATLCCCYNNTQNYCNPLNLKCKNRYHYLCAVKSGCVISSMTYNVLCPKHIKYGFPIKENENNEDKISEEEEKIENNDENIIENEEENKINEEKEEKDNLIISIDNDKKFCFYCKLIINEDESIKCAKCKKFFHESCVGISHKKDDYDTNENESEEKKYICLDCLFDKKQ